ncbi:aldo/keto reductase [Halococcoides cellulosivorans]|uniref:Aldo/keto reductase n=1 Tax=Halococcoides cellulosivorans TaxID=1679096 RepID=A0A2R4X0V5_9EURY|nr:aldo/keto reductase [Halococcoides cellulosivorans]AWB27401.1 aldo/keto reductase [Halococcoides cellulosivorans]
MEFRELGSTGHELSAVGLGTWNIGGAAWGDVDDATGREVIRTALDSGVTFVDTADVYGDGRSESHIGAVLDDPEYDRDDVFVATKAGRRLDPHEPAGYDREHLERFVDRSLDNLGTDTLDLLQLHCPPTEVYYQPETFEALDALQREGKIGHYGVSVEKVEEGLKAIEYDGVESVQIIFNMFRQRPADLFFDEAARRDVGVIARVPLASGLLTGAIDRDTEFPDDDHRNFNRDGEAFDRGETFAGLPFEDGLDAVEAVEQYVPEDLTLAQTALRWILDFDAVTSVIPGSTSPEHIQENVAVADRRPLDHRVHGAIRDIYEESVYDAVHQRW